MTDDEIKTLHDEIWRQIYNRQKKMLCKDENSLTSSQQDKNNLVDDAGFDADSYYALMKKLEKSII